MMKDSYNFIFLRSDIANGDAILDRKRMDFLYEIQKNSIDVSKEGTPVFYIESGGSEEKFKKMFEGYKPPFLLVATSSNNSLPASLEIMSFLRNNKKDAYLIHGEIDEIIKGLKNLSVDKLDLTYNLNIKEKYLANDRLGVIGKPSDWLIASNVDYKKVKDTFGAELIDITFEEFKEEIEKEILPSFANEIIDQYHNDKIDRLTIIGALHIYSALKALIEKYQLTGLTVRCFDLLGTIKNTSCLGLALLNSEGIVATCEGDIPSMLSMMLIYRLFNQESFQCNPSYINVVNNYMVAAHCTLPLSMAYSYKFDTHFESGIGVGIKGELDEENVTIFKINNDLTKFVAIDAYIKENLNKPNLCRSQIKIKSNESLKALLDTPLGNHLLVFYGNHKKELIDKLGETK